MSIIESIRPYFEVAYFTAGIVLAGTLWISRSQLSEIRLQALRSEGRLARERAIEASKIYLDQFVALSNESYLKMKDRHYKKPKLSSDFSKISLSNDECIMALQSAVDFGRLPALNSIELVAAYFVSGVADEKTGFQIFGKSFCESVRSDFDFIFAARRDEIDRKRFFNTIRLYEIWHARMEKDDAVKGMDRLQSILKKSDPAVL